MNKFLIILWVVGMTATPLSARTIKAIFLEAPKSAPRTVNLYKVIESDGVEKINSESIEVPLPRRNLSNDVKLPDGDLKLVLVSKTMSKDEIVPQDAQRISIPATWKNSTVVIVHDAKNTVFPGKAFVINASDENLAKGDTMVLNLSDTLVKGIFGSRELNLKPQESGMIKDPVTKDGRYQVIVNCILPETKKRYSLVRANWSHVRGVRQIVFVVPTVRKTPRLWSVTDNRD